MGRGCPVDWNEKEQRYNWELVYCELYAGGKYDNNDRRQLRIFPGPQRPGRLRHPVRLRVYGRRPSAATGHKYTLHFERGEIVGEMKKEPYATGKKTGTCFHWQPDLEVFTDIAIPA